MSRNKRVLWIVPEDSGGIQSYSTELWPAVRTQLESSEDFTAIEPIFELPNPYELTALKPDLIHIQHEYGLFGSKLPFHYRFPTWVKKLKEEMPAVRLIATAHTVLNENYTYPWKDRGWQTPLRVLANLTLLPSLRKLWTEGTWSHLDGVIVHSDLQQSLISKYCEQVCIIPHYVPDRPPCFEIDPADENRVITVFGYFSPEKGQDIAIRAMIGQSAGTRLLLAGGVRRPQDRAYYDRCLDLIRTFKLQDRIEITGYVEESELDAIYRRTSLVLVPFRETSGSGSVVQAFARAMPILASDLALNHELAARVPGSVSFFKSEDSKDCAIRIRQLLEDPNSLCGLAEKSSTYGSTFKIVRVSKLHADFYRRIVRYH